MLYDSYQAHLRAPLRRLRGPHAVLIALGPSILKSLTILVFAPKHTKVTAAVVIIVAITNEKFVEVERVCRQ
jgi:hypothetical protein